MTDIMKTHVKDLALDSNLVDASTISSCLDSIENRLSRINGDNISKSKAFFKDALKKIIVLFGGTVVQDENSLVTQFKVIAKQQTDLSIVCNIFKLHQSDSNFFNVNLSTNNEVKTFSYPDDGEIGTIPINAGESIVQVFGLIHKNAILHDSYCEVDLIDEGQSIAELSNYYLVDAKDIDESMIDYGIIDLQNSMSNLDDLLGDYDEMAIEQIKIPANETSMSDYKFSQMKDCRKVIFSNANNLTAIGSYAFANNVNTESLVFPDNVEWIGSNAFTNCQNLKNVVFPSSLTAIYDNAFEKSMSVDAYCLSPEMSGCTTISSVIDFLNNKYPQERHEYTDEDYEYYTKMSESEDYESWYEYLKENNYFVVDSSLS